MTLDETWTTPVRVLGVLLDAWREKAKDRQRAIEQAASGKKVLGVVDLTGLF